MAPSLPACQEAGLNRSGMLQLLRARVSGRHEAASSRAGKIPPAASIFWVEAAAVRLYNPAHLRHRERLLHAGGPAGKVCALRLAV